LYFFGYLVQPKIIVNENHFQFNRKSFSGFKLFILAHTFVEIRYRRALEFVGRPNIPLKVPEFWYPIAGIRRPIFRQNRSEFGRCSNLVICTEFGHRCRIFAKIAGILPTNDEILSLVVFCHR
jgi:hypothetical protein